MIFRIYLLFENGICAPVKCSLCPVQHADFSNDGNVGFPNDVATLKWTVPVSTSEFVAFANLANAGIGGVDFLGSECRITGWGKTKGCKSLGFL